MAIIDFLAFQEKHAASKSLAIVGSSDSVLSYQNGSLIDDFDLVVRFNRVSTQNLEKHIGSRTDILVANDLNSLDKSKSAKELSNPKTIICFTNNQGLMKSPSQKQDFIRWCDGIDVLILPRPDLKVGSLPYVNKGFSMGIYALGFLPSCLDVDTLFVTGFTFFGAIPGGDGHHTKDKSFSSSLWHDAEIEKLISGELLNRFKKDLLVTPEVFQLINNPKCQSLKCLDLDGYLKNEVNFENKPRIFFSFIFQKGLYKFSKLLLKLGYLLRFYAEKK